MKEILEDAHRAESSGNSADAVKLYKDALTQHPLDEHAYTRLMLLFRKQKNYKKELAIIIKGINVFEKYYRSKIPKKSKMIIDISNKLNRSIGLSDKKGNILYNPEPIAKWKKRKLTVEKRLSSS